MNRFKTPIAVAMLCLAACAGADSTVGKTEIIGGFSGHGTAVHPDNLLPEPIAYYGTDLGFTYTHKGMLQILFGDTWATEAYAPIEASTGSKYDDGFGTIDLGKWPDPKAITPDNIPVIRLGQNAGTNEMSAMNPEHAMDLGKTPMAGFSNGTREFAIFNITKPKGCASDNDCSNGTSCDTGLGIIGVPFVAEESLTISCLDGSTGCQDSTLTDAEGTAIPESGLCIDTKSSVWDESEAGRLTSTAINQRVGMRSEQDPRQYNEIHEWLTTRFSNMTATTVERFDPANIGSGQAPDYRPAKASDGKQRVFIWGRPGFVGVKSENRSLGLYFAYVDIPTGPGYGWDVHYYSGSKNGIPQFSNNESDAATADLDADTDGIQPDEQHDVVHQMSVEWIEPLNKWVMFYGGSVTQLASPFLPNCGVLEIFARSACKAVDLEDGAIYMRAADNPWGPWSAPQDVLKGGNPDNPGSGQYGPGGVLHHPLCKGEKCAPHTQTAFYKAEEYGFLYSANIITEWTQATDDGADIIWNASTWDPYRVVLLRTHISK